MVNTTGGKNYKKSKHASGVPPTFIDKQSDQIYGRVVKNLGDRNILVFCNDNYTRICHIRGSMRKRVWINVGDIILISLRDFESKTAKGEEKGDVVAKFDETHFGKLRKQEDINQRLFMQLETMDGTVLAEIRRKEEAGLITEGGDDWFDTASSDLVNKDSATNEDEIDIEKI